LDGANGGTPMGLVIRKLTGNLLDNEAQFVRASEVEKIAEKRRPRGGLPDCRNCLM
jgi:hypothetical protein